MNNGRIDGFNNVKVSDAMVAIIMKLAKGERVIKQEVDGLKKTEQMLYDTLLSLANLHKKTPNNKDATITSMKERMQLIGGEIEAGNDNRALVKELGTIVKALKSFGVISNKEAIKYLSQF
jgi:predicted transcriptional regulator YheO